VLLRKTTVGFYRSVVGAGDAAGSPSIIFFFFEKLIRFGRIWLDLGKIKAKFGQNQAEIWATVIRFGQI